MRNPMNDKDENGRCLLQRDAAPWVKRFVPLIPRGGRVLDVAAGGGRHTALFIENGLKVTAADIDIVDLQRRFAGRDDVEIVQCDMETGAWPWDEGVFDAVAVTFYLDRARIADYYRSLREGGVVIMETFTRSNKNLWGRPGRESHFLEDGELITLLPEGARLIAYEEGQRAEGLCVARMCFAKPAADKPFYPIPEA